ncbi:MAG: hypothetical protein PHY29_00825 [Syntrophales bacterium]|nr:hypothetical protein [Syntrophales bacterium]
MGKSWGTTATSLATSLLLIPRIALPLMLTPPFSGTRMPSITLISVVFPEPLGPMMPKNSPRRT